MHKINNQLSPVTLYERKQNPPNQYSRALILCDHGSNFMPPSYQNLGLSAACLRRHIAYDIGIKVVGLAIHKALNIPMITSEFSRLLIDPNRSTHDPTLIMKLADGQIVPGNREITDEEREKRIKMFYAPYHKAIENQILKMTKAGNSPILISLHSFTDNWKGTARPWQLGFLSASDRRLSEIFLNYFKKRNEICVGDNEPYNGALKGDCMDRHGIKAGLPHTLIEVRQDLITSKKGQQEWANILIGAIQTLARDINQLEVIS